MALPTKKGRQIIKPVALTSFWHRRVCEATALIDAIILALFLWATTNGLNTPEATFAISVLAASIAACSLFVAIISYFLRPEGIRNNSAFIAYILLLVSIGTITLQTGQTNSPFLALWMVGTIFCSIFGIGFLAFLSAGMAAYAAWLFSTEQLTQHMIFGFALAGFLPLVMSYILWHGKSNSERTKERAYYDLANELDQVSNKSEAVINAISDGVIAINDKGLIELINPAAEHMVGWAHQDAINLDYKSVLHLLSKDGHDLDKTTDPVFEVLSTNHPKRRNDLQMQTGSGKKIYIDLVISPIGRIGSGVIIVFRDVTKEQAEERAQAEFISTASHEMRTPVASIEGYLGLALNPATASIDSKARDFITKAHLAAQHLGHLFQDLLDVTKADDGRLSNNPKVIDAVQFTADVIEGLKPKADEKKLRLFFKPTEDRNLEPVFYVHLDADHLREVLANLIENAIKYTPAGEVVVSIDGDEDHVVISVQDSGIGIPTEDIPHLFQKFYRVDNSDTREIGGTGLGLYLCRRLVEAMGGRIWVESEYKKGSAFSVELPRITHEEAQRLIEATSQNAVQDAISNVTLAVPAPAPDATPPAPVTPPAAPAEPVAPPPSVTPEPVSAAPQQPSPQPVPQPTPAPAPQVTAPVVPDIQATASLTPSATAPVEPAATTTDPLMSGGAAAAQDKPPLMKTVTPTILPLEWQEKIAKAKAANSVVEQPIELPPAPVAPIPHSSSAPAQTVAEQKT